MNSLDSENFNNFLKCIKNAFDEYYKSGYYCRYYCPDNEGCKKEVKDFSKIKNKDYFTSEFKFDTSLKLKWCNEDYMYLYYDDNENKYIFEGCSLTDDYNEQFETFDEFYKYMTNLFENNMDLCELDLSDFKYINDLEKFKKFLIFINDQFYSNPFMSTVKFCTNNCGVCKEFSDNEVKNPFCIDYNNFCKKEIEKCCHSNFKNDETLILTFFRHDFIKFWYEDNLFKCYSNLDDYYCNKEFNSFNDFFNTIKSRFEGWFNLENFNINKNIKKKENEDNTFLKDFIYKIDESNKLSIKINYNSLDEFFASPFENDEVLNSIFIATADTHKDIMRIEKSLDANYKVGYRFIVSINTKDNESFCVKTFIKSKEHLNTLIQQTIDALKQYPQFSKYIDDLENCLI